MFACVFLVGLAPISANAADRVALVMGNSNYEHVTQLPNPSNDARDLAAQLGSMGFDVSVQLDLNAQGMRNALQEFNRKTQGASIALVYFAGHGIELNRTNYLIPTDAKLTNDSDITFEAISLDLLNQAVAGAASLRIILLDACRDNPFLNKIKRSTSTRSLGRGLAKVEPAVGTLVSFAAKEGTVAFDGEGKNSPYTSALIKHLREPALEVNFLFRKVRDSVLQQTSGDQEPFVYGSLPAKGIFLNGAPTDSSTENTNSSSDQNTNNNQFSVELEFWQTVKNSRDENFLKLYKKRYPNGAFVELADILIAKLQTGEPTTPVTREPDNRLEILSAQLVAEFNRVGSAPINQALGSLSKLYARNIQFFGKVVDFNDVYADKRNLFQRWPNRNYFTDPGSITTTCQKALNRCDLRFLVEWTVSDPSRNKNRSGRSEGELTLSFTDGTPKIIRETSRNLD